MRHLDGLRRHRDSVVMSHLVPLLDDLISVFENLDNSVKETVREELSGYDEHIKGLVHEALKRGEKTMTELADKLTAAVKDLQDAQTQADSAIQTAIADLKNAQASGDQAAMQAAVDAISSISSKMKTDTDELVGAMTAPATPAPAPSEDAGSAS